MMISVWERACVGTSPGSRDSILKNKHAEGLKARAPQVPKGKQNGSRRLKLAHADEWRMAVNMLLPSVLTGVLASHP